MAEEEVSDGLEENYENDFIDSGLVGVLDMINFKIVPKEPGDPVFSRFKVIPPEPGRYGAEYVRFQEQYEKLKEELSAMASSSELQVREELTGTKEALEKGRKMGEKAKKYILGEQEKIENLREMVSKMQQQLIECEKKNQQQLEEKERLEQLISSTRIALDETQLKVLEKESEIKKRAHVNEELRKQNEEMGKVSRFDKDNLNKIQKEKDKLEEKLRKLTLTNSQLEEKLRKLTLTNSQLEEKLSKKIDTSRFELQIKLDTLQVRFSEMEDKWKEEIAKCLNYRTKLEETTSKVNIQQNKLIESAEIITDMKKEGDEFMKTKFEPVVQANLGLENQVVDLRKKLREKTSEVESVQRELKTEREEKSRMQAVLQRCQESLQSWNLERAESQSAHVPVPPAPQVRIQQNEEVTSPPLSTVAPTLPSIPDSVPMQSVPTPLVPLKRYPPSKKMSLLPKLSKKMHAKDQSKCHLGYYCVCGRKKESATALHSHISYLTSEKKFKCEFCGHRSLYLAGLKQHLKSSHKFRNSRQLDLMGMGCSFCGKIGFATLKELTIHKAVAHSLGNNSSGQSKRSTGNVNQTEGEAPRPSTSRGLNGSKQ